MVVFKYPLVQQVLLIYKLHIYFALWRIVDYLFCLFRQSTKLLQDLYNFLFHSKFDGQTLNLIFEYFPNISRIHLIHTFINLKSQFKLCPPTTSLKFKYQLLQFPHGSKLTCASISKIPQHCVCNSVLIIWFLRLKLLYAVEKKV